MQGVAMAMNPESGISHVGAPPAFRYSPPLECAFGHIPFSRRWDTVRYSGIQPDTARYVRLELDTVGDSGIQWICCKMARCSYGEIQAGYRLDTGGTSQKYTPGESSLRDAH